MKIFNVVRKNTYYDSVTLMLISKQLKKIDGVDNASVMMGTPANIVILTEAGLLNEEGKTAGPNDLILAFRAPEETDVNLVCQQIDQQLSKKTGGAATTEQEVIRTSAMAFAKNTESTLAFISLPGEYASIEALRALKNGKNVFLFSDNVSIEEEVSLKKMAVENGLLVMGPDCGTAIINGVGLGFANRVQSGEIGIVAASGTGLQEVTCLLDAMGLGISQAIGTGGRDLKESVGAITMLAGLEYLIQDNQTKIIVLISKPPAKTVVDNIFAKLSESTKPAVVCFIGHESENVPQKITAVSTLEEAALQVAKICGKTPNILNSAAALEEFQKQTCGKFNPQQKYVRALYAGGTLCYEAILILSKELGDVYSNTPLRKELLTNDVMKKGQHTAIDLGDDEFTKGRPHPMIDGSLRNDYIKAVATDEQIAVLLLDVVIGFGATSDPAGDLVPVIAEAQKTAQSKGNHLAVVAYVCGTALDEQNKKEQIEKLQSIGVFVANSNAEAARLVAKIVNR